jgi:predicted RNA-binding protein with PIN domain
MKQLSCINYWVLLSLFLTVSAQGQPSKQQEQIAHTFIGALFEKEYSQAWNLLEPEVQKKITVETLKTAAKPLDELALQFGKELIPFMYGYRTYQNGQSLFVHTYKFKTDVSKGIASALVDVVFRDAQATTVSAFLTKFSAVPSQNPNQISTSTGQEVTLEKEQQWLVEGKAVSVNELALILDNTTALFAIKVWDEEAKGITQQRAKEKAIPIVKYAIANGYLPKAELGASQAKRKLLEGIGVAFIQPGTHGGYRIIIAPADYK